MTTRTRNPIRHVWLYVFGERWKLDLAWFGKNDWRETADYYHMKMEEEDISILGTVGSCLRHIHMADQVGRTVPVEPKTEYEIFFRALHKIGYDGTISIEGYSKNRDSDLPLCRDVMGQVAARE